MLRRDSKSSASSASDQSERDQSGHETERDQLVVPDASIPSDDDPSVPTPSQYRLTKAQEAESSEDGEESSGSDDDDN